MSASREKDQADFDLERFVDMFDEAMTSSDPRVVETLRKLMMIVALTRPEAQTEHSRHNGPLRRLFDDMYNLNRSMNRMDEELRNVTNELRRGSQSYRWEAEDKYTTIAAAHRMAKDIDTSIMQSYNTNINGLAVALGSKNKTKGSK